MLNKYCTYIHDSKIIIETREPTEGYVCGLGLVPYTYFNAIFFRVLYVKLLLLLSSFM